MASSGSTKFRDDRYGLNLGDHRGICNIADGLLPCSLSSRNLLIAQWSLPCNLRLIVLRCHLNLRLIVLRLLSCSRHSSGTPPSGRSAAAAGARAHREPRAHRADGRGAFMSEDRGAHQREQGGRATSPRALGATLARLGQRRTGSACSELLTLTLHMHACIGDALHEGQQDVPAVPQQSA